MNQLVFVTNNQPVTDSLKVAEVFMKNHKEVLRDIKNQIEKLDQAGEEDFNQRNFAQVEYTDSRNRKYPKFVLTEEAFTLVAMSYVTPEAMKMKVKFINEFKRMREHIANNKVVPLSKDQALVTVLRTTADLVEGHESIVKEHNELKRLVTEIDNKVEEQITLDHGEQRRLQKGIATKVYELCDDPQNRPQLFRELHREIKDRFGVASYKDLKRKELQSALRYIENWIPRKVS